MHLPACLNPKPPRLNSVCRQVWWTWETEDVFRRVREGDKHAMKTFAAKLTKQLTDLTGMVRCGCWLGTPFSCLQCASWLKGAVDDPRLCCHVLSLWLLTAAPHHPND